MKISTIKNQLNLLKRPVLFTFFVIAFLSAYSQTTYVDNPYILSVFQDETMPGDVIIEEDCFASFRGTVKMQSGARIIVRAGGAIMIDNATITHVNDDFTNTKFVFWGGIVVEGIRQSSQEGDRKNFCHPNFYTCMTEREDEDPLASDAYNCFGLGWTYPSSIVFTNITVRFTNGAAYLNHANIRYAATGMDVKSNGLIYVRNSTFENFYHDGINFTYNFNNTSGLPALNWNELSLVQNNTFKIKFKNTVSHKVGACIKLQKAQGFVFPFSYNWFTHDISPGTNTNVTTRYGILNQNARFEASYNTFSSINCGIYYNSNFHTAKIIKINNNTFYNCYAGIWSNATDNTIIKKNTIYPADYDVNKAAILYGNQTGGKNPAGIIENNVTLINATQNSVY